MDLEEFRRDNPPNHFDHVLPLNPPHYVDLSAGRMGVIETNLSSHLAVEVAAAPAIPMSEVAIVKQMTFASGCGRNRRPLSKIDEWRAIWRLEARSFGTEGVETLPLPDAPDNVEIRAVRPVPRLELMVALVRLKSTYLYYISDARHREAFPLPVARVSFDYAGEIVIPTSSVEMISGSTPTS